MVDEWLGKKAQGELKQRKKAQNKKALRQHHTGTTDHTSNVSLLVLALMDSLFGRFSMQRFPTALEKALLKIKDLMARGFDPAVAIECVKPELKVVFTESEYIDAVEWIIEQMEKRRTGEIVDGEVF